MTTAPDWLDDALPLINPAAPPRVFTRRDAHAYGWSDAVLRQRVRRGTWVRAAPGVYVRTPEPTPDDWARAAILHGGPAAVLSGRAALRRHGLRTAARTGELVLVPRRSGVRGTGRITVIHTGRLPPPTGGQVPLAPFARAVADEARTLRALDDVRAVVAQAVQRGFTTVDCLAAELAQGPSRGSALFRRALDEVGSGARSAPEARAATALRRAGIGDFEQNADVWAGGRRFVADFLWRARRAILEIDGREYHLGPADWAATLRRDTALQTAGWSVVHMRPAEVLDERDFVGRIRLWLAARPLVA